MGILLSGYIISDKNIRNKFHLDTPKIGIELAQSIR